MLRFMDSPVTVVKGAAIGEGIRSSVAAGSGMVKFLDEVKVLSNSPREIRVWIYVDTRTAQKYKVADYHPNASQRLFNKNSFPQSSRRSCHSCFAILGHTGTQTDERPVFSSSVVYGVARYKTQPRRAQHQQQQTEVSGTFFDFLNLKARLRTTGDGRCTRATGGVAVINQTQYLELPQLFIREVMSTCSKYGKRTDPLWLVDFWADRNKLFKQIFQAGNVVEFRVLPDQCFKTAANRE
ncbi:hypothetical protein CLF_107208, partial [Clonorchis sinensis]